MNRYTLICRLRGPAYLLLTGVLAMMAQWTSIGWGKTWPLYIVLAGVLQLAQRWALSQNYPPPVDPYMNMGVPYAGAYPGVNTGHYSGTVNPAPATAIVPAPGGIAEGAEPSSGPQSTEWRS